MTPRAEGGHLGGRLVPAALIAVAIASTVTFAVRSTGLVGELSYLVGLAAAAALAWVGFARRPVAERRPWGWLAVGVTLNLVADTTFQLLRWAGQDPEISVADVFWIAAVVALSVGLLGLGARASAGRGVDLETVIDALVAVVVGFVVVWEVALDQVIHDTATSALVRSVLAVYPVADVVLLALVVRLLVSPARSRGLALVAGGTLFLLAADLGYVVDIDGGSEWLLSVGWMLAMALIGWGTLDRTPATASGAPPVVVERGRMWFVMAPLLVPVAFLLWGQVADDHPNAGLMLGATLALLGLAAARADRLLHAVEAARLEVQAREHLYRALAANASDAVFVADHLGVVREGEESLARLLGVDREELAGANAVTGRLMRDSASLQRLLERTLREPGVVFEAEAEISHPDGPDRWLHGRVVNLLDDPLVGGIVANVSDITDRKRAEAELRHQAFHDGLTGLANRALLTDRLGQALRRGSRRQTDPAVIYLDVDGFKSVNDRFGHDAGDQVLREIADRLRRTVRAEDTVARLGGDEFAILIEDNHVGADEARTTADRILQALTVPIELAQPVAVTVSLGLAVADAGGDEDELLRNADIAMYRAKTAGKDRVVVYDQAMGTEAGEAVLLEVELADALRGDQLELHYQPVVDLISERVVGFEALLRWQHPRLGLVPPDRFIPLSEETGLIVPIGRWVLETACATAARWQYDPSGRDRSLTMAVNLSARQLASDEILDDVRHALAASGLDARCLVLEMTETALVTDPVATARRLHELSALGLRLAIDDFGTGYSSLAYLRQFPIDILKIDRSFVDTITDASDLPPIVRGLLDLGHRLDLEIVAEGIEHVAQRDGLRLERCPLGQGFLFSRPVPGPEAELLLDAEPAPAR